MRVGLWVRVAAVVAGVVGGLIASLLWVRQVPHPAPIRRLNSMPSLTTASQPSLPPKQGVHAPISSALVILCYHDISRQGTRYTVSPQQFEAHLRALKANGFVFLTVSELVALLDGKGHDAPPQRAVAITLDDGFRSAYSVAFPLLQKYGAKATLFIYTQWIAQTKNALTWRQLQEMARSGLVEIAAHSVTHAYPRRLRRALAPDAYRQRWLWEFRESKRVLEQRLGVTVRGLAYPGGQVDKTLCYLAQKAGYEWAVAINPKPVVPECDRYALPRFGMDRTLSLRQVLASLRRVPKTPRHARRVARRSPTRDASLRGAGVAPAPY